MLAAHGLPSRINGRYPSELGIDDDETTGHIGAVMPRKSPLQSVPERLLASGLELFLRQGYNGTGIQQITDAAGVPKGSFYNHFASKEAFAGAIVDRYEAFSQQSWTRMMANAPPEPLAAIRHVFAAMLAHHEHAARPSGCLIGNLAAEIALASPSCRQRLLAAQLAWRNRLASLIDAGQRCGEIRTDVDAIALSGLAWCVWEGALLRMKVEGSVKPLQESIALVVEHLYLPLAGQTVTASASV